MFKAHHIPAESEAKGSLVHPSVYPIPHTIKKAFNKNMIHLIETFGAKAMESVNLFATSQWSLGGKGSGSAVGYVTDYYMSLNLFFRCRLLESNTHKLTYPNYV